MKKEKSLAKDILYSSLCQAICRTIKHDSSVHKLFWLVSMLASFFTCSYFVYESLALFVSNEVNTNTRTIYETSSVFPKITYCNKNPFTTKYSYEIMTRSMNYSNLLANLNTNNLNETTKERVSHALSETLFECTFNGESCDSSDFVKEYIDKNLGFCYSFNAFISGVTDNQSNCNLFFYNLIF